MQIIWGFDEAGQKGHSTANCALSLPAVLATLSRNSDVPPDAVRRAFV